MIPEGWVKTTLGKHVRIFSGIAPGQVSVADAGQYPYVKVDDLNACSKILYTSRERVNAQSGVVPAGSVIFPKRGASILTNKIRIAGAPIVIDTNMMAIAAKESADNDYIYYFILNEELHRIADVSTIPQINNKHIVPYQLALPSVREQQRIAMILKCCDMSIESIETLVAAKQCRRQALVQRLLTGKARLPGYTKTWQTSKIQQLLKPVRRPVSWDDSAEYRLLSLRRRSGGAFHRETLLGSEILTKKMNVARAGDFLISKMQVVHGAMAMVPPEFDGFHVSDSYLAYTARSQEQLDMRFFDRLSRLPIMYHKAYISSYGVHIEKMTFNDELFLGEKVTLPPTVDEQSAIVEVLEDADREIALHRAELDALKRQKRGLMQQLLTGKVRVP